MRNTILGWVAIAWGALILITGIVNVSGGRIQSGALAAGQAVALCFAVLMLYAGVRALWMEHGGGGTKDRANRSTSGSRISSLPTPAFAALSPTSL
jgi:hypothetical protein